MPGGNRQGGTGPEHEGRLGRAVLLACLISIPIWAGIALALILAFQEGPVTEVQGAAFAIAAAVELMLLRLAWRNSPLSRAFRTAPGRARAVAPRAGLGPMKRTGLLAGAVGAYLHYYYWDVQLQIASLHSVTVFVPVRPLG